MALDYILDNTGPEVQERLDQVPVTQAQLTEEIANREAADVAETQAREAADSALQDSIGAETTRAEGAEQALDGRITSVEGKVPQDATPQNPLADKEWVTGSIATATAYFITASVNDLVNYYLKSETYTKAEVQQIADAIKQFNYQSVPELPTASAATTGIIYLVPSADPQAGNVKDEYITVYQTNEMGVTYYSWEQIGSTAIDLADYYTKSQTDAAITADINTALASYSTTAQMNTAIETAIANLDLSDTYETKGAAAAVVGDAGADYDTLAKIQGKLEPIEGEVGDKVYEAGSGKGLGRKNLPLNSIGNKNLLSQSMINQANTVYVIQNDYEIGSDGSVNLNEDPISVTIGGVNYYCKEVSLNDSETILLTTTGSAKIIINDGGSWVLYQYNYYTAQSNTTIRLGAVPTSQVSTINYIKTGGSITIPANCTLKFDGGSIGGGALVANGAKIEGAPSFNNMTDIQGVFKMEVAHAENFGFGGDDDTKLLGFLFDMAASGVKVVLEKNGQYETKCRTWYHTAATYTVPDNVADVMTTSERNFYDDGHYLRYYNNLTSFDFDGNNATILMSTNRQFMGSYKNPSLLRFMGCSNVTIQNINFTSDVCHIAAKGAYGVTPIYASGDADKFRISAKGKHLQYVFSYGSYFGCSSINGLNNSVINVEAEDCAYALSILGATDCTINTRFKYGSRNIHIDGATRCNVTAVGSYVSTNTGLLTSCTWMLDNNRNRIIRGSSHNILNSEDDGTFLDEQDTTTGDYYKRIYASMYADEGIAVNNRFEVPPAGGEKAYQDFIRPHNVSLHSYDGVIDNGVYARDYPLDFTDNKVTQRYDKECNCRHLYGVGIGDMVTDGVRDETVAPPSNFEVDFTCIISTSTYVGSYQTVMDMRELNGNHTKVKITGDIIDTTNNNTYLYAYASPSNYKSISIRSSRKLAFYLFELKTSPYAATQVDDTASLEVYASSVSVVNAYNIPGIGVVNPKDYPEYFAAKYTNLRIETNTFANNAQYPVSTRRSLKHIPFGSMSVIDDKKCWYDGSIWRDCGDTPLSVPKSGLFADKPDGEIVPIGYQYYCTDLHKQIVLLQAHNPKAYSYIQATSLQSYSTVLSGLTDNRRYCAVIRAVVNAKLYASTTDTFTEQNPAPGADAILLAENNIAEGTTVASLVSVEKYFTSPDKSTYPYLCLVREANDSYVDCPIYTGSIVWGEYDGATAGVLRTGTTAQRPAGNGIYVGFRYFDTDLGKTIYASAIASSSPYTVTWVEYDGEAAGTTEGRRYVGDFSADEFVTNAVQSAKLENLFNAFKAGKECYVPQKNEQNQDLGYVKLVFDYATTTTIKYTFNYDGRLVGGVLTNNNGTYTNNITILLAYTIGSSGAGINVLNASSTTPADGKILKVKNVGDNNLRVEWDNA